MIRRMRPLSARLSRLACLRACLLLVFDLVPAIRPVRVGAPVRRTPLTAKDHAGRLNPRPDHADEAQRALVQRLEAVQLVAGDVHHVPLPYLVDLVAQSDPRTAGDDHHSVVVGMALASGPAACRDIEVPDPIARGALGLSDQLVLADAGQRRIAVLERDDALPPGLSAAMDDAHLSA